MRILQVMAGNAHGGAETAYVDMCIAMHQHGNATVEAVTRPNDIRVPRLQEAGITVHELPFGGWVDIYTPWKITQIINQFQPDIVQSWMSRAPSKVPAYDPSKHKKPYVHVGRLGSPYKPKYFQSCDAFVAITPDLSVYINGRFANGHTVKHINNFAEVEAIQTPINRSDYGIPEDATVLLGLGRLHDDKAFDVLIKAVKELPDNIYAWIAGEGPAREELEALIEQLDLQDRVKLLGWQSERAALFDQSDICTFISREEGFGTVFVQSWALKTPVIVSDADGPRQYVIDGRDGLVVPIDDVSALVNAVNMMVDDQNLRESCIENGYDHYKRAFTKEVSIGLYLAFYQELLDKKASQNS